MSSENIQPFVQLCMRRNLHNLDKLKLPDGYTLRTFRSGDLQFWNEIINRAFDRDNMDFNQTMRADYSFRKQRVLFICSNDKPVATAAAWYKPEWGMKTGYLHMVGTHPEHSGKGLGFQVSLAALYQMAYEGRDDVVLLTDDYRIPALKTYLKLGFEPLIIHENQRQRWLEIFHIIGKPDLSQKFKNCLEAELLNDEDPKPDLDCPKRYKLAHRWHADRPHRLGTGLTDTMGDESLYKASLLGNAKLSPSELPAGSISQLKITYTAGKEILHKGTKIIYYVCGQNTLSKYSTLKLNTIESEQEFFKVCSTGKCKIKAFPMGFEIIEGVLEQGNSVELTVGGKNGFEWTPVADRYEIKVMVQTGEDEPVKRLPEPLAVEVRPLETERLQVMLPCTHKQGALVKSKITARDRFDNRVNCNCEIELHHKTYKTTLYMIKGYAETELKFDSKETECVTASIKKDEETYKSNPCVYSDELQLYTGDLHVHDFLSAAHGMSDKVYEWGRDDRNLDFISVSVQNHGWVDNEKWAIAKYMNERYLEDNEFVTFLGNEWQHSGYADKIIHYLGGDQPFLTADDKRTNSAAKLYEAVRASDALIISHHVAYKRDQWCPGADYDVIETDVERLVELWSMHGSSEGFDINDRPLVNMDPDNTVMDALRNGLKLGFVAGSDTHSGRPGGSAKEPRPYWGGLAAVWAPEKTRRSLFSALYNRHTYALTDARIVLKMTVNGALMGSETEAADMGEIKIEVWAPSTINRIQILKNTQMLKEFMCDENHFKAEYTEETKSGDFYHCRIVLKDGNLAVASPVWIK